MASKHNTRKKKCRKSWWEELQLVKFSCIVSFFMIITHNSTHLSISLLFYCRSDWFWLKIATLNLAWLSQYWTKKFPCKKITIPTLSPYVPELRLFFTLASSHFFQYLWMYSCFEWFLSTAHSSFPMTTYRQFLHKTVKKLFLHKITHQLFNNFIQRTIYKFFYTELCRKRFYPGIHYSFVAASELV